MPFVAIASPKGQPDKKQRVVIYSFKNPRAELSGYDLACPLCGACMSVRQGDINIPHFWHPEGCTGGGEGESLEHEVGKDAIYHFLLKSEQYKGANIDFEHWFDSVRRRADVFVKLPDGGSEVHEMQLAYITPEELQARTNDYFRSGVNDVHWWLGGKANNDRNKQWCKDNLGYIDIASIQESVDDKPQYRYNSDIN